MEITRQAIMEIDLEAFKFNVESVQKFVGKDVGLMPVIKANGYGTHINTRLEILDNFKIIGVAIVDEAIALRKIGYKNKIFVLNQPGIEEIEKIIKYDITIRSM